MSLFDIQEDDLINIYNGKQYGHLCITKQKEEQRSLFLQFANLELALSIVGSDTTTFLES